MTCIECPLGCLLNVDIENCKVVTVSGNKCPKGEEYAKSEVEDPQRILTSAVLASGLAVRMVPVRTDKPIAKSRILEAAQEIRKLRVRSPVKTGEVIVSGFLGLGVNLLSIRDCPAA